MPWTPGQFRKKSKKLTRKQARKGAKVANAILRREGEGKAGMAIATGIARASKKPVLPRPKAGW